MWRVVSSRELFKHPRVTLVEDTVELPDGSTTDYLLFKGLSDAVTVICRDGQGRLLLQREYSHPVNKTLWQFPGGKIEDGEEIIFAANRELQEESGYRANQMTLLGTYLTNNRRSEAMMHVVLAEQLLPSRLTADVEESIESQWIAADKLIEMIRAGKIVNVNVLAALQLLNVQTSRPPSDLS